MRHVHFHAMVVMAIRLLCRGGTTAFKSKWRAGDGIAFDFFGDVPAGQIPELYPEEENPKETEQIP